MIKEILKRGFKGFIILTFVSAVITILNSLIINDGNYYFVTNELIKIYSTPLNAFIVQFFVCGFIGFIYGATTLIWEQEKWSLTKQTLCHFFIVMIGMTLSAYLCRWIKPSPKAILMLVGCFIAVYGCVWTIIYLRFAKTVKEINKKLE